MAITNILLILLITNTLGGFYSGKYECYYNDRTVEEIYININFEISKLKSGKSGLPTNENISRWIPRNVKDLYFSKLNPGKSGYCIHKNGSKWGYNGNNGQFRMFITPKWLDVPKFPECEGDLNCAHLKYLKQDERIYYWKPRLESEFQAFCKDLSNAKPFRLARCAIVAYQQYEKSVYYTADSYSGYAGNNVAWRYKDKRLFSEEYTYQYMKACVLKMVEIAPDDVLIITLLEFTIDVNASPLYLSMEFLITAVNIIQNCNQGNCKVHNGIQEYLIFRRSACTFSYNKGCDILTPDKLLPGLLKRVKAIAILNNWQEVLDLIDDYGLSKYVDDKKVNKRIKRYEKRIKERAKVKKAKENTIKVNFDPAEVGLTISNKSKESYGKIPDEIKTKRLIKKVAISFGVFAVLLGLFLFIKRKKNKSK